MNKVILIGRICNDLEVKTSGDTQTLRFNLAVDRRYSKGDEKTDFITCLVFNKKAEFIAKYFKKGSKIGLEGEWRTGSYTKDGQKVYTNECLVTECEFVDSKGSDSSVQEQTKAKDDDFIDASKYADDMPF